MATVMTIVQLRFHKELLWFYGVLLEHLLELAQVPVQRGPLDSLIFVDIPSWSVETFNPVAVLSGALGYGAAGLGLALGAWRVPRLPFPMAAWLALVGIILLISTLVLVLVPLPRFTPEVFSAMWVKLAVATALIYPWFWALLVGGMPLSSGRIAFWGLLAWVVVAIWNIMRLAFFLALARAAGVIWLPLAFMLGSALPDCVIFIIYFNRVLVPAGPEWGAPS